MWKFSTGSKDALIVVCGVGRVCLCWCARSGGGGGFIRVGAGPDIRDYLRADMLLRCVDLKFAKITKNSS